MTTIGGTPIQRIAIAAYQMRDRGVPPQNDDGTYDIELTRAQIDEIAQDCKERGLTYSFDGPGPYPMIDHGITLRVRADAVADDMAVGTKMQIAGKLQGEIVAAETDGVTSKLWMLHQFVADDGAVFDCFSILQRREAFASLREPE